MLTSRINKKFNSYQRSAARVCLLLQRGGGQAYWVGGAVRDMLLGRENYDIDIATDRKPGQVKRILKQAGIRCFDLGEKFGTVGATVGGRSAAVGSKPIEITTFRTESGYSDFRHPKTVKFINTLEADAKRRDFSINALYFNPVTRDLVDTVGGFDDLRKRRLRFVGSAVKRIQEDPLRMLRAVRLAVELGFEIETAACRQIKKHAGLIKKISAERIKQELDRIVLSENALRGVELLDSSGLLKQMLPELDRLKKVLQSRDFHAEGNAFIHSLKVFEMVVRSDRAGDIALRYAALLHDIGKFGTARRAVQNKRVHISFHNHAAASAAMFSEIAKRLRFSREQRQKINYLIAEHMRLLFVESVSQKKLKKWAKNRYFNDLITLRITDNLGSVQTDSSGRVVAEDFSALKSLRIKFLRWQKIFSRPLLSGDEIMRAAGLQQSKKVGELLERIKDAQLDGAVRTKKQALRLLKNLDIRK